MLHKKIELPNWSIKVFKFNVSVLEHLDENEFNNPTIQAEDITDVPAEFVSDPFIILYNSKYYLFFEVLNKLSERGEIGLAVSIDGERWLYEKIVIRENYHLSYPHVFKFRDQIYMIPESKDANAVFLYKASEFPYKWEKIGPLINGQYVDPTIFSYENKWWMYVGADGTNMHLFYSNELEGAWTEHPKSPIITNNRSVSRPAGRVWVNQGEIYRFAQDGLPYYGKQVRAIKIKKLSQTEYEEEEGKIILRGSDIEHDWRKDGMHHIDQLQIDDHEWIIAVDGHIFVYQTYLKWKILRFLRNPFSSLNRLLHRYLKNKAKQ